MNKYAKLMAFLLSALLLLSACGGQNDYAPEDTQPTLSSQLSGPLTLGSKMPELTFTTDDGEIKLSQLLQEKKMVMLNFWFADCIWCQREFPAMEVSYQKYRDKLEIIAVNPYDSAQVIRDFQKENALSFPMTSCSVDLANALGVNGYPTSVVIDREGTICLIHPGAVTDTAIFDGLFDIFTADDYTPRVYNSLQEIFG